MQPSNPWWTLCWDWVCYSMAPFTAMVNCAKNKPKGYSFIHRAIPRILLQAYHTPGVSSRGRFNGMFAFRPVGARFRFCWRP